MSEVFRIPTYMFLRVIRTIAVTGFTRKKQWFWKINNFGVEFRKLPQYLLSTCTHAYKKREYINLTYLSLGSIHVVFLVLWSMKYTFPSKSCATSHPSGSGISPFRLLGIFHCALNPSKILYHRPVNKHISMRTNTFYSRHIHIVLIEEEER